MLSAEPGLVVIPLECHTSMHTHTHIYWYLWCPNLNHREVKVGKIHIVALLIFVSHVSLGMEINVYVDQDFRWAEVNGIDAYELLSYALPIFIELLLDVCTMAIKIFIILACIITTCIDLFIKILVASVIYVIQFSSRVLQMLVQDLFTLAEAILIMM